MKKTTILAISLMISILITNYVGTGCGNNNDESKAFSKYGFSFEYPENFSISRDEVTDAGLVRIEIDNMPSKYGEVEAFQIVCGNYDENDPAPDLDEYLYLYVEGMHELGICTEGPKMATFLLGHEVPYRLYTLQYTDEEEEFYHVVAAFYCDVNNRLFSIIYVSEAANDWLDAIDGFMPFLDNFICH